MAIASPDDLETWAKEDVMFVSDSNEISGILTKPMTKGPYPALVLLHGSERSGVNYPFYSSHSHNLVRSGYAVLRYDSPGVGKSSGSTLGESLEDRAQEVIKAVKYLQSRKDIVSDAVGLWGHSQGGWICQIAAAEYDGIAFIIPVSGPGVTPAEQEVHRVETQSRAAGFTEDEVVKAVLMRRLFVDIVLPEPMFKAENEADAKRIGTGPWNEMIEWLYSDRSKPEFELNKSKETLVSMKNEPWARFLFVEQVLQMFEGLSPEMWEQVKASFGAVMTTDPAGFLTKVNVPVLAIFGEADKFLPVAKSVALYRRYLGEAGNEDVTIRIFPDADHKIFVDGAPAPGYYDTIIEWLRNLFPRKCSQDE
jgi:pimeloyl-ACP methyl ester carboxylesterase